MSTHPAVVTVAAGKPLEIHQLPTVSPSENEVRVRVEWTASTPLDFHQADGGFYVEHPQVLGDTMAGAVVEVGSAVNDLKIGDRVFGFAFATQKEKAYQVFATVRRQLVGKIPPNVKSEEAATVPDNGVTAFHALTTNLGLTFPWPRPENYTPNHANTPILIWGAAGSVGQYCLQILKHWNYTNVIATAAPRHHEKLRGYGAAQLFDYSRPDTVPAIAAYVQNSNTSTPTPTLLTLDCIGSQAGSVEPILDLLSRVNPDNSNGDTRTAALLPIQSRDPSRPDLNTPTVYTMETPPFISGVRTHFYEDANPFYSAHLQPTIIPSLVADGVLEPNYRYIVAQDAEGKELGLLERAERAIEGLKKGEWRGGRAVWRVWREEEHPEFA